MRKFPALHTISAFFKILSWIVGLLTIVLVVVTALGKFQLFQVQGLSHLAAAGIILLAGAIYALILHAVGEMIMVFLAIEENTRQPKV
jgi:hypothetical protein